MLESAAMKRLVAGLLLASCLKCFALYTFRNGGYTYEVLDATAVCGDTCEGHLTVRQGDKTVLDQVCKPGP
jgi:hypothetical protein